MKNILRKISILIVGTIFTSQVHANSIGLSWGIGSLQNNNYDGESFFIQYNIGFEFIESDNWNYGLEYESTDSSSSSYNHDLGQEIEEYKFDSKSLFMTARPIATGIRFKAGLTHLNYVDSITNLQTSGNTIALNEIGVVYGVSILIPYEYITIHIFDYQRYRTSNLSFNTFSVNLVLLLSIFDR